MRVDLPMRRALALVSVLGLLGWNAPAQATTVVFSNAQANGLLAEGLRTDPRPAGGDYSRLQGANADLGQLSDGLDLLGDHFQLTSRTLIEDVYLYAYFEGSTQPIIGGSMVVLTDGPQGAPKSVNNGQVTSTLTDIYRVRQGESSTSRTLQRIRFDVLDRVLEPGTYFIKFTTEERNGLSPFVPFLTKADVPALPGSDALHASGFTGGQWVPIRDSATGNRVELPFEIWGTRLTPPGDANGDGLVSGADYTIWADHFGAGPSATFAQGDFNLDGFVTGADYTIWADHYGEIQPAIPAAEPSSGHWFAIALLIVASTRSASRCAGRTNARL